MRGQIIALEAENDERRDQSEKIVELETGKGLLAQKLTGLERDYANQKRRCEVIDEKVLIIQC